MAALEYYTSATKYIMSSHDLDVNYLRLLLEYLNPLKFLVSCRVCSNILQDPMSPDHTACQHTVCQKCIGGKMKLRPTCGWCKTYENFVPNKSLVTLIQCYSKLCQYTSSTSEYQRQINHANEHMEPDLKICKETVASLLKDGSEISDTPSTTLITTKKVSKSLLKAPNPSQTRKVPSLKLIIPGANRRRITQSILAKNRKGRNFLLAKKREKLASNLSDSNVSTGEGKEPRSIKMSAKNKFDGTDRTNVEEPESLDRHKKAKGSEKVKLEKKGCGCGNNSGFTPGKLTCYGQRCPCYSGHNPCMDCKCKGCRNPNKIVKIEQASEDTDGDEINVD